MTINFEQPITAYELIAIILSLVALIVPLLKWWYDKYIKKLQFDFLPSGMITLFFNKSGSYISLGGVFEAKNKPAVVKNISAKVIREADNATLAMNWSTFSSPVFRNYAGNVELSFETAHPFKVEADMLSPAFVEFENAADKMNEITAQILEPAHNAARRFLNQDDMNLLYQTDKQVRQTREFQDAKVSLNDYFFWKKGKYQIILTTKYNDMVLTKNYEFALTEDESEDLRTNIDNLLVEPIANHFHCNLTFHTVRKNYSE